MGFGAFATATGLPRGAHRRRRRIVELGATPPNGVRGHSDRRRDHPHPAWAEFTSLRAQPQPSLTLVQMRPQSLEPTRQRVHRNGHSRNRSAAQPNERLFHREPYVRFLPKFAANSAHQAPGDTSRAAAASRLPVSVATAATMLSIHGCMSSLPWVWYSRACSRHSSLSASREQRDSGVAAVVLALSCSSMRAAMCAARGSGSSATWSAATSWGAVVVT